MRKKLTTVPDFVVRHVGRVTSDARAALGKRGGSVPALRYFRDGHEFSMPMEYRYFVMIGDSMKNMASATVHIARMGPEFAFLAAEIATRANDPASRLEDQVNFIGEIGHILKQIAPQAFFVTMPVRVVTDMPQMKRLMGLAVNGVPQPSEPNALMVTGCNRVRSYVTFTEFSAGDDGTLTYSKPKVFDSLKGNKNEGALFREIYEPSRN